MISGLIIPEKKTVSVWVGTVNCEMPNLHYSFKNKATGGFAEAFPNGQGGYLHRKKSELFWGDFKIVQEQRFLLLLQPQQQKESHRPTLLYSYSSALLLRATMKFTLWSLLHRDSRVMKYTSLIFPYCITSSLKYFWFFKAVQACRWKWHMTITLCNYTVLVECNTNVMWERASNSYSPWLFHRCSRISIDKNTF